jgi:hypothetical protein
MIEIPANIITFFNELENDEMIEFLAQLTEYAAQVFGDHSDDTVSCILTALARNKANRAEGVIEYED